MAKSKDSNQDDIQRKFLGIVEQLMHIGLDLVALQTCLIDKGVISADDLADSVEKTQRESKTASSYVARGNRGKPN